MRPLQKIKIMTAAWILCCGFAGLQADAQSDSQAPVQMNRQFCAPLHSLAASTVCESSIAASRQITGILGEAAEPDGPEQNPAGQNAAGQIEKDQSDAGQNDPAQDDAGQYPLLSGQETAYIHDGRYLIQYLDSQMGIYDLSTLKDGAFGDYVIRFYDSFRFTENMKDVFLKTAMNDASFQEEPYFTYYAESTRSRLELYTDENGTICGICYDENLYDNGNGTEIPKELTGFLCTQSYEIPWEESEYCITFETETYYQDVPSIQYEEGFRNYKESYEYNDAGQVTDFLAEAETNCFSDEWSPITVAGYHCVYREDGSKKEEALFRHSLLFSTFASSVHIDYDGSGRITYIHSYVTHGSLDYYFIYEDDGGIPACSIVIDHYPGPEIEGNFYRYT